MNIQDKLRAANVMRWHTVPTSKTQSVAEHSFNVAVMSQELCIRMKLQDSMPAKCIIRALHHDLHEIIDGDTPAPVKLKEPRDWGGRWLWTGVVAYCDILDSAAFISQYAIERHGHDAKNLLLDKLTLIIGEAGHDNPEILEFTDDVLVGEYQYEW